MSLTAEELKRLEELEAKESAGTLDQSPKVEDDVDADIAAEVDSILAGTSGTTPPAGLSDDDRDAELEKRAIAGPAVDELTGIGTVAARAVLGEGYGSLTEMVNDYNQTADLSQEIQKRVADDSPVKAAAIDIAGQAARGLTAAATAGPIGAGVESLVEAGLRSESRLTKGEVLGVVKDMGVEGLMDLVTGKAGSLAAPAIGRMMSRVASNQFIQRMLRSGSEKSMAFFKQGLRKNGDSSEDFVNTIMDLKDVDGAPLIKRGKTPFDISNEADELARNVESKELVSTIGKVKSTVPAEQIRSRLLGVVSEAKTRAGSDAASAGEIDRALEWVMASFGDAGERTALNLHNTKVSIFESLPKKTDLTGYDKIRKESASTINNIIEELVAQNGDEAIEASFNASKKKLRNIKLLSQTVHAASQEGSNPLTTVIRKAFTFRAFGSAATGGALAGGAGAAFGFISAAASEAGALSPIMAKSLKKVGDEIAHNPQKWSKMAASLMISANSTDEDFIQSVSAAESMINLDADPVKRTMGDTIRKEEDIYRLMDTLKVPGKEELRKAIQDNNSAKVGQIMDQISKIPGSEQFIEQGMGWDGKITNEQDFATLDAGIRDNPNTTPAQKLDQLKQLHMESKVPTLNPEPVVPRAVREVTRDENGKKKADF